jgi:hypothetical protein
MESQKNKSFKCGGAQACWSTMSLAISSYKMGMRNFSSIAWYTVIHNTSPNTLHLDNAQNMFNFGLHLSYSVQLVTSQEALSCQILRSCWLTFPVKQNVVSSLQMLAVNCSSLSPRRQSHHIYLREGMPGWSVWAVNSIHLSFHDQASSGIFSFTNATSLIKQFTLLINQTSVLMVAFYMPQEISEL